MIEIRKQYNLIIGHVSISKFTYDYENHVKLITY
jgi:hypothetical protein